MKKPQHKFTGLRCATNHIGQGACEMCAECGWVPFDEKDSPCVVGRYEPQPKSKPKPKPMTSRGMYADMAAEIAGEASSSERTIKGLLYTVAAGLGIVTQVLLDIRDQVEDLRAASTAPPKDTW